MQSYLGGRPVEIHSGLQLADQMLLPGLYGLDVESTYLTDKGQFDPDFKVRTVQIATKDEAWVFDLSDPAQRDMIDYRLRQPDITFCSHTDMDVMAVWAEFGIDIAARNVDTRMLAIQSDPDNNADRDLKTLATRHGMPELEAGEKVLHTHFLALWTAQGGKRNAKKADVEALGWNTVDTADPAFIEYAALDAIACRRLAEILVPLTQAPPELLRVDQWLHVRAARQRMAGKRIDVEALTLLHEEAKTVTGTAKGKAEELTGGVNVNGPKVLDWFTEHGVNWVDWPGARTVKGAPSLAKENIKLLFDFPLDDVGREVAEQMVVQKGSLDLLRKTTDITHRLVTHADGIPRIHPLLNPIGATTTARMSSSGPNIQNASKKDPRMRGLFLPEPGYTFVTIDFDQIELRVVAALAREEKMIQAVLDGYNLHQLTVDLLASMGVEITYDEAKTTNFLIVYGGGAQALHDQTGMPLDVAQTVIRSWRESYTSITALAQYLGMEREAIRTISNRHLPVTRVKGSGERAGDIRSYANINYAVQSAAREVLVDSWIRLEDGHNRPGVVWLPVHDELVLMVPDDEVEAVIADAEASMRMDFRGVPITASAIVLRDREGISRWMTGKNAEIIQKDLVAA